MPFYGRRKSNVAGRKVAKQVKKYVKSALDAAREDKVFDLRQAIAEGTVATDTTGSVVLLSGVQAGTTYATRIGETINAKSLHCRISAAALVGSSSVTNFRVIVFMDRQIRSSTLPAVTDVLETANYDAYINHVAMNANRFKILYDKWFSLDTLSSTPGALTEQSIQTASKNIKINQKITYTNASTGTQRNNIYILYLSDKATASAPSVNVYSRLVFEDA